MRSSCRGWRLLALASFLLALIPGAVSAAGYKYRVTDPLTGSAMRDLNTDFWEPWSDPGKATSKSAISSEGFTLSGHLNYLGSNNSGTEPRAKWTFGGDFRVSIHIKSGTSEIRRNHVTIYEVQDDCVTLGEGLAGLWGGKGVQVGNSNDDHYPMPAGTSAYYLFVKQGAQLAIYEGNDGGASETDKKVIDVTLPNPDGKYIFYLGVGSPNDNTMTAKDFELQTERLDSCPAGEPIPSGWQSGTCCACSGGSGGAGSFAHRVTDPLTGSAMSDLNTGFWEPWSEPGKSTGEAKISSEGFTLSDHLNYLGWDNSGSAPRAKWTFGGDFRVSIHVKSGDSAIRRNHVTVYELTDDCMGLGKGLAGLWGGAGAQVGNSNSDHYPMPANTSAYYLFVKQGAQLAIYEGNDSGATDSDKKVIDVTLPNPDGEYIFYLGVGSPNDNTMTTKDFVLEADRMTSCAGASVPATWCGCGACGGGTSGGGDGGTSGGGDGGTSGGGDGGTSDSGDDDGGGCSVTLTGVADLAPLLGLVALALLLVRRRRRRR